MPSSAWWAGTPQKREPGSAAFGQRLPLARTAAQRPEKSSAPSLAAAEGRLGLGLGELGVALDVDLPAGETRGEAGVHALLADRERELVVGSDDGRLACASSSR